MFNLLPQLMCAVAEKAVAQLIAMDVNAPSRLSKLHGKQLSFKLAEWPTTIVLTATAQGMLFNQHNEPVDCAICTNLSSLRQLRDPSQLTRLIKADALQIEGDLQVAQQFSAFFQQLAPDWQEALSGYLGDAAAHKVALSLQQTQQYLTIKLAAMQQMGSELAQDELLLTPTKLEMTQFSDAVSQLAARVDILQQKLRSFEDT